MKLKKIIYSLGFLFLLSCSDDMEQMPPMYQPMVDTSSYNVSVNEYVPVFEKAPSRTIESVEKFNLETPLRCEVDWETQTLISTQSFYSKYTELLNLTTDLKPQQGQDHS